MPLTLTGTSRSPPASADCGILTSIVGSLWCCAACLALMPGSFAWRSPRRLDLGLGGGGRGNGVFSPPRPAPGCPASPRPGSRSCLARRLDLGDELAAVGDARELRGRGRFRRGSEAAVVASAIGIFFMVRAFRAVVSRAELVARSLVERGVLDAIERLVLPPFLELGSAARAAQLEAGQVGDDRLRLGRCGRGSPQAARLRAPRSSRRLGVCSLSSAAARAARLFGRSRLSPSATARQDALGSAGGFGGGLPRVPAAACVTAVTAAGRSRSLFCFVGCGARLRLESRCCGRCGRARGTARR
jgi:hypothetical protein